MGPGGSRTRLAESVNVVAVRQAVRALAEELGFAPTDVTRIVVAVSELARNALEHGTSGWVQAGPVESGARLGIEVVVDDEGPGIADPELALQPGYSTGRGRGLGLPGARRLMDEIEIGASPEGGARVLVRKWLVPRP